ncbi:hypothetical protein NCC49_002294 [Naganishia albida]|nr:hypothetical protein NCC49_002294 [Naganishia albida]
MSLDDFGTAAWADETEPGQDVWAAEPEPEPEPESAWGERPAQEDERVAEPRQDRVKPQPQDADEGDDDDFGDFGDFGGGDFGEFEEAEQDARDPNPNPTFTAESSSVWQDPSRPPPLESLALDPFPPPDLADQLSTLLDAIFPLRRGRDRDPTAGEHLLTREPIRSVEGPQQILLTDSSRDLYAQLVEPPSGLKPLEWKRSRVRREMLISLGVPVNLDEVDTTRLPPLKIVTKQGEARAAAAAAAAGRPPQRQGTRDEQKLGPPPEFDRDRAERLLSYREDQLALVPPAYLTRMQSDLVSACSAASALVAHLKQIAEVRTDENRQRNEQIAGLIAQAQRIKAGGADAGGGGGGGGGGLFKRASVKRTSMNMSGVNTPRTNSPRMR